jgi:N-formylglutamate deformylase
MISLPIILHIPHSFKVIPCEARTQFLITNDELNNELNNMTDAFTDDLFTQDVPGIQVIVYPVSRLVVDPERFIDDNKEPMSKKGMGVVYLLTSDGKKLRRSISEEDKNRLVELYNKPHHDRLNQTVETFISTHKKCLIIDCHSFPSAPLPYETEQSLERPDICIGTDAFHTPDWLTSKCAKLFQGIGYSTEINHPFSGSLVPGKFYQKNREVLSIMIELNRRLYMNEKTGEKNEKYQKIKSDLSWILNEIRGIIKKNL